MKIRNYFKNKNWIRTKIETTERKYELKLGIFSNCIQASTSVTLQHYMQNKPRQEIQIPGKLVERGVQP